ncbi:MAG: glucose-1-phosphate thymidylyltransferase [Nitrospinota bacterium]
MKALILSGGEGTRLRPITHTSAKQLVPVANKPILFFGIESIVEAGITDIGIIVGSTKADIQAAVGDGSRWGAKITYIEQEAPLGLAHAVLIAEKFLKQEPFVMYLGDNLIKGGITRFVNEFTAGNSNANILLAKVPNPSQFGVAELAGGKVVRLIEKPKKPKSDLALVGVYLFDKNIFTAVKKIKPSWRNELEITDAIQTLIDLGFNVQSHVIEGWWKDTGKLEDMLEANRIILDTFSYRVDGHVDKTSKVEFKVVIEKGARIINSTILGPAIIGENTVIKNAYIGPFTSIENDVHVEESEVEQSIILSNSSVCNMRTRIAESLIGKGVEISRMEMKPKVYRLMLGDSSKIGLP